MQAGNETDLNIILKLIDQATGELKKALGEVKKETDGVEKSGDKASKTMASGFKQANAQLRDFRRMMLVAGVAVGAIIASTREWANSNEATHSALESIMANAKTLAGNIGSLLSPAIVGISDALKAVMPDLTRFFDSAREGFTKLNEWVTYGVQWWVSYAAAIKGGATATEAYGIAANVAGSAAEQAGAKMRESFKTDTSAQVNELEESIKSLGATWASWTDETTQGDMISLTTQAATMQQSVGAYQQYYSTVAQLDQLSNDQELQNYLHMTAEKKQAMNDMTKAVTMTNRQQVTGTVSALGQLESALAGAAEMGKGWAKAAAAVSLAMAIINTAQGVTMALAEYPWPFSLVVAGIVAAAGAIQVATIASTKFAAGTDSVPAMVSPGEMIIPTTFAQAIRSGSLALSGPSSTTNSSVRQVYIDIKVDRPTVSQVSDIDYLVEEVSRRVAQEVERIR
jgi:rubrerythrin